VDFATQPYATSIFVALRKAVRMTCVPQPSQVNTESSSSEGGLVGVTEEKTNRPEQTGQGMIKDGNWEDATLC
jgi:hypothetical protein